MAVISWRTDVNKEILDSTSITIGEGGLKEDASNNGYKQRRATALGSPTKFSVTMDFNWSDKDQKGLSEFDKFQHWYKYEHQYGTNPFWFPSITRFNINGSQFDDITMQPLMCQYVIASAPSFSKAGLYMRCTMNWEEVYGGVISIEPPVFEISSLSVEKNGEITINFSNDITNEPYPTQYNFGYKKITSSSTDTKAEENFTCTNVTYSGRNATYYVNKLPEGNYVIGIGAKNTEMKNTVVVNFED